MIDLARFVDVAALGREAGVLLTTLESVAAHGQAALAVDDSVPRDVIAFVAQGGQREPYLARC